MRVLLVPNIFFPSPPGGTEVGVLELAKALRLKGVEAMVAAPHWDGEFIENYQWEGVPVWRYRVTERSLQAGAIDMEDPEQSRHFESLLQETGAEVLSLHAWMSSVGVNQIMAAQRLGIPVVVACHLANVTCPRGSGMRWGKTRCNLLMDGIRCPACVVESKGVPLPLAYFASYLALGLRVKGTRFSTNGVARGLRLAPKMRMLFSNRRKLWRLVDEFVVQSRWYAPILKLNGIPEEKIKLAPVCLYRQPLNEPSQFRGRQKSKEIVVGFLGRLSRAKGVDLLVKAMQGIPSDIDLEVRIHGIVQSEEERLFQREIQRMAAADSRIRLMPDLSGDEVLSELSQWDLLCVPSRVQDMRPQVILEAFSAGVPVIGTALGGIPDLVEDGINGWLFPANDSHALETLLLKASREPGLIENLREGIPPVHGVESLAVFMADRYQSVKSRFRRKISDSKSGLCAV